MCTIGAVMGGDRAFLLKNFDYRSTPTGWAHLHAFEESFAHFALVDHEQKGVNSGLNAAGLGLLISRSKCDVPTPEKEELRTVLNAHVLANCADVPDAVEHIEAYAAQHPTMLGGNVLLCDGDAMSVTEYFGGKSHTEVRSEGFLLRANHSVSGIIANQRENSLRRYAQMESFLKDLHARIGSMDRQEVVAACKQCLTTPPVLNPNTRSSFVIDIRALTVDYCVGENPWQTYVLGAAAGS